MEESRNNKINLPTKIVACIPAFNAADSIYDVVVKSRNFADEVIVVDDGSTDDTCHLAKEAGATVVTHAVNLGYGSAIATCLRAGLRTGAAIVVTLDADSQHNPDEIPFLVRPILEGVSDIVTGSRFVLEDGKETLPAYRKFGITLLTKVTNFVAQTSISDATTGFRAYSNSAATILASKTFSPGMGASSQILMEALRSGLQIKEVPVTISYRTGFSTSTQNAFQMGIGILTSIIRYIAIRRPLSMIGIPGLGILSIGVVGIFLLLDIFNTSRMIPTGLGMLTVATCVIGLVLLLGSLFLYSLSTMSKLMLARTIIPDTTINVGSKKTSIIRYIAIRRPLSMIGIPGLGILSIGVVGIFLLLDIFNTSRMIPTGLGMLTVAATVIGLVFLMTSVILFTMSKLFNTKNT